MVFDKITDTISTAKSKFSASKTSAGGPYLPIGSPLCSGERETIGHGYTFSIPRSKNNLRLSASLQDLSSFHRFDVEEGNGVNYDSHFLQRQNGGTSFSKEKPFSGGTALMRRKWIRFVVILLCLLLLGFLSYVIFTYIVSYWSQGSSKFYVVLDCGSTGTRVHVYQATIDHENSDSLPMVLKSLTEGLSRKSSGRAYDRMETEPGLHMLVHNRSGLEAAINPLVRWAEKQIPRNSHKATSLFLYATAGVRRLPSSDSKWLLDNSWSILKKSPFSCHKSWIKVISGMDEAYYGWIALNYRTGVLGNSPKKATFGALDMGGSSLQVTFESKNHGRNKTELNLRIGAENHHLTAYSLAGYGLNDAFDKSVVHILKGLSPNLVKSGKIEIKHPCLQTGFKEQYICSQCAPNQQNDVSPVAVGKNSGKGIKSGVPVQLIGSSNWKECSALAKVAVNLSEWSNQSTPLDCDMQPCALPLNFPRPYGQFYGMSGFFVVFRFFNLSSESSLDDVLDKGREFCAQKWDIAKSSVPPQPFIEQYCFRAPYIVSLLREGLHITDNQILIGSGSITWTLGVALYEAGKAFSPRLRLPSYQYLQTRINPVILVVVLITSLILLVFALSCPGNWMARFFRRPYIPLFRHNSVSTASVLSIPSPFRFQRWSPISSGDGRGKLSLSPTVAGSQPGPFSLAHGLGSGGIQLMESSLYPSTSGVSHIYSASSLGQIMDSNSMGSCWSPHRSQMRLQSRRSQSREDLSSSLDLVKS